MYIYKYILKLYKKKKNLANAVWRFKKVKTFERQEVYILYKDF